jgi:hypothetical protein
MDQIAPRRRAHQGTRFQNRLTELKSKRLTKPGRHADGAGLYLDIGPSGTRHWVFLYTRDGQRRELGLGGYPATSITEAREKAREHRGKGRHGGRDDPWRVLP